MRAPGPLLLSSFSHLSSWSHPRLRSCLAHPGGRGQARDREVRGEDDRVHRPAEEAEG